MVVSIFTIFKRQRLRRKSDESGMRNSPHGWGYSCLGLSKPSFQISSACRGWAGGLQANSFCNHLPEGLNLNL